MNRLQKSWLTLMLLTVAVMAIGWWNEMFTRDSILVPVFILESFIALIYMTWRNR